MLKVEKELDAYKRSGVHKFMKRVLLPVMSSLPASVVERSLIGQDPGLSAGLTTMVGRAAGYELRINSPSGQNSGTSNTEVFEIEGIHPIFAVHDNSPYFNFACFTFSHRGNLDIGLGVNPNSAVFGDGNLNEELLERIVQVGFKEELERLVELSPKGNDEN